MKNRRQLNIVQNDAQGNDSLTINQRSELARQVFAHSQLKSQAVENAINKPYGFEMRIPVDAARCQSLRFAYTGCELRATCNGRNVKSISTCQNCCEVPPLGGSTARIIGNQIQSMLKPTRK